MKSSSSSLFEETLTDFFFLKPRQSAHPVFSGLLRKQKQRFLPVSFGHWPELHGDQKPPFSCFPLNFPLSSETAGFSPSIPASAFQPSLYQHQTDEDPLHQHRRKSGRFQTGRSGFQKLKCLRLQRNSYDFPEQTGFRFQAAASASRFSF